MKRWMPGAAAALVAAVVVLANLGVPLVEDGLFWWAPKALLVAEQGPSLVLDQLPQAAQGAGGPPQWAGGLPDYGHPPLWFWYLGLWIRLWPGATHVAVHLAALPLAMLFGWGGAALLQRAGGRWSSWGAVVLPVLPPVAAQLARADTDLPLLALTPWALVMLLDRRDGAFAAIAALATWCKEPGILLAAPAVVAAVLDRRWRSWGWVAPPLALAAWAGLHFAVTGWGLAGSERLPETLGQWLRDLGAVAWLTLGAQGRVLAWPLVAWALVKGAVRRRGLWVLAAHVGVQVLFFGTLNYLGGLDRLDAHTHVRYLLPGMVGAVALAIAAAPLAAPAVGVAGLAFLFRAHWSGPEASLYGVDVGRALARIDIPEGAYVGSYAYTQLTRPYAGVVEEGRTDLRMYGPGTTPEGMAGARIVEVCEGEPLGRLQELPMEVVDEVRVRDAWVRLHRVTGPPTAPAPSAPPPPPPTD